MLLYTLLQTITVPDVDLLPEKPFQINPTNVYYWLVWGLLGFVTYLKIESTLKSWTIRKKDKYIETLHTKLIEAEKNSITLEEADLYKKILSHNRDKQIVE